MLENKSYVYIIRNTVNDKVYIGKANNPENRWLAHKWITKNIFKYFKYDRLLYRSIYILGVENFSMEVIEKFNSEKEAYKEEVRLIALYNSLSPNGYNSNSGGSGGYIVSQEVREKISKTKLGHKHTQEAKNKMSIAKIGKPLSSQHKEKISKAKLGHIVTPETRLKISIKNKGSQNFLGHKHTQEVKNKMSERNGGEKNKWAKLTEVQVKEMREKYQTGNYKVSDLAKLYPVSQQAIRLIIRRKRWNNEALTEEQQKLFSKKLGSCLDNVQILNIIKDYIINNCTYKSLGIKYGVHQDTIGSIIRRKTWKCVEILQDEELVLQKILSNKFKINKNKIIQMQNEYAAEKFTYEDLLKNIIKILI